MPSAPSSRTIASRVRDFCDRFALRAPILEAPMVGAGSLELAASVANAGGMGALAALQMEPVDIQKWCARFRTLSSGSLQLNVWIPDPAPHRDLAAEDKARDFIRSWGPLPARSDSWELPDFSSQCAAMLNERPTVVSSIMGVFPEEYVGALKDAKVAWFACVTNLQEALVAERAGADAIVVQGFEAGGHRGSFNGANAELATGTLFSLLPRIVDNVTIPVIAAGAISDGRTVSAAIMLGASAVQIGTGFLRSPEATVPSAWADALVDLEPNDTIQTRVFSGRLGRSVPTELAIAARRGAAHIAPYPIQRGLTSVIRKIGIDTNDITTIQAWAGQGASLALAKPASTIIEDIWNDTRDRLSLGQ